jgi:hypothetical protein
MSELVERKKTLKKLSQIICNFNQQDDERRTVDHLSLEFYKQAMMAEDYVCKNEIGGAEAHRLIAEAIHNILNIY